MQLKRWNDPEKLKELQQKLKMHPRLVRTVLYVDAAIVGLIALGALTLTVLINVPSVHGHLIGLLQREAADRLGIGLHLENFALHLSSLSADLYGVRIDGESPYQAPPVLQVRHIHAGVRVVSFLRGQWYFDTVEVEQPVVQVFVDKNGHSNLPVLKSSGGDSKTDIFDLGIRHAVLSQGEVIVNDHQQALAADLHDVEFHAWFNSLLKKYSATFSYNNGRLHYGGFEPYVHSIDAAFDATREQFNLDHLKLQSDVAKAVLSGTVQNYADPQMQGKYWAEVDGTALGKMVKSTAVPQGIVETAGSLQYHRVAGHTLLADLSAAGTINSSSLLLVANGTQVPVQNLSAKYALHNGDADLPDLQAVVLGGKLRAQGTMRDVAGDSRSSVTAYLDRASIAVIDKTLARGKKAPVTLTGTISTKASATWGKSIQTLVAKIDTTLQGQMARAEQKGRPLQVAAEIAAPKPAEKVPFNGEIHATYAQANGSLAVANSFVRAPETSLTLNGAVSRNSSLAVRFESSDLAQLETMLQVLGAGGQTPLGLAGSASFQGTVRGSIDTPQLSGQLNAANVRVHGTQWKVVRTGIALSPSMLKLTDAELDPADRGRIALRGSVGLDRWSATKTSPFELEMQASQIDGGALVKAAGLDYPVAGIVNANVRLHGTEIDPVGDGTLAVKDGSAYGEPIRVLQVKFDGKGREIHGNTSLELAAGSVNGEFVVNPEQRTYNAQLRSTGVELSKLESLKARNVNATGQVRVEANGHGTFDDPGADATIDLPSLSIQGQTINHVSLQAHVANHIGHATLAANAVNTSVQAKADVQLQGNYMADASLNAGAVPLQTVMAIYAPEHADDVTGQTEVHATLHGPLKEWKSVEAHVNIPVLKAQYQKNIQLAATNPIQMDYRGGVVTLQPATIRGTDTDLEMQGSIPTNGEGKMSLRVLGNVNLELAQLFDPDVRSSGMLKFHIDSSGSINDNDVGGQIDIVDANFASADYPVGLQHGNGVLKLTKDRLNIAQFQGAVGGGTVTAQGGIAYRPNLQFDLGLNAKGIRVLYPQGMRETADAYLRLTGTEENALLGGAVNLSDLSFTPAFDLTTFVNKLSGGVETPSAPGFSQNMRLNIAVHSTNNVNLVSRTLSVGGTANLQVKGTASDPVLLGRVNLTGGDVILNGNRFVLTGGTVQFINPSETQPVVNLTLATTIQQYNISMRFNGPTDQLTTQYTSDPSLPQADIINLLAFGQTTEAKSTSSTGETAESVVASQVSSQVTSRVSRIAGISQLSINPVVAGSNSQGPPGANITIQQRVTGNLFVTFSTNVASTQGQTIQGQYQVTPRVAVSATRDPNGGFAFDTLIKKSW